MPPHTRLLTYEGYKRSSKNDFIQDFCCCFDALQGSKMLNSFNFSKFCELFEKLINDYKGSQFMGRGFCSERTTADFLKPG